MTVICFVCYAGIILSPYAMNRFKNYLDRYHPNWNDRGISLSNAGFVNPPDEKIIRDADILVTLQPIESFYINVLRLVNPRAKIVELTSYVYGRVENDESERQIWEPLYDVVSN